MQNMSDYASISPPTVQRVAAVLRESLSDLNLEIRPVAMSRSFGHELWTIEVTIPGKGSLTFNPAWIDNGASGIDEAVLVAIRQAAGQEIALPNRRRRTDAYQVFNDIMTVDPHDRD